MHMAATMRLVLALALVAMATTTPTTMAQNSAQDYLDSHNAARAEAGLWEVGWDTNLQAYAEWYADQRRGDCALQHSDTQSAGVGENLFWGGGAGWTGVDAVNTWVDEKLTYDYDSNTCWGQFGCGHYTQVMWQETTSIGCARVDCDNDLGVFITCNYFPPGNVNGRRPWTLAVRSVAA